MCKKCHAFQILNKNTIVETNQLRKRQETREYGFDKCDIFTAWNVCSLYSLVPMNFVWAHSTRSFSFINFWIYLFWSSGYCLVEFLVCFVFISFRLAMRKCKYMHYLSEFRKLALQSKQMHYLLHLLDSQNTFNGNASNSRTLDIAVLTSLEWFARAFKLFKVFSHFMYGEKNVIAVLPMLAAIENKIKEILPKQCPSLTFILMPGLVYVSMLPQISRTQYITISNTANASRARAWNTLNRIMGFMRYSEGE